MSLAGEDLAGDVTGFSSTESGAAQLTRVWSCFSTALIDSEEKLSPDKLPLPPTLVDGETC